MGQTEQRESELLTLLIRIAKIESHVEHYREIDVENLPDPASYQKTLLDLESQLSQLDQQGREAIRELATCTTTPTRNSAACRPRCSRTRLEQHAGSNRNRLEREIAHNGAVEAFEIGGLSAAASMVEKIQLRPVSHTERAPALERCCEPSANSKEYEGEVIPSHD